MTNDLVQKIKESLLEDLIAKMSDQNGDRMKPKGLAVEVAAPDKAHLADGLDKAKDVLGSVPEPDAGGTSSEDDDEQRLMQLLGGEDEDEEDRR